MYDSEGWCVMADLVRKSSVNAFTVVGSDAFVSVRPNAWDGFHKVSWASPTCRDLQETYISVGQARVLVDALTAVLDGV